MPTMHTLIHFSSDLRFSYKFSYIFSWPRTGTPSPGRVSVSFLRAHTHIFSDSKHHMDNIHDTLGEAKCPA